MCDLDSDIAGSSQRIEPKPKTQLSSTVRLVTKRSEDSLERTKFDHDTLNQEKHDNATDLTSTGRPVCGHEFTKRCVLTPRQLKVIKQVRRNPWQWIKKRNTKLISECKDCPHSVVKEAEHLRVQELVQRIENHPHRAALQADLQQNNIYNPFSEDSKEMMIRELGNVELFELCETTPKVQRSQCPLSWNQGTLYCTLDILTDYDWMHSLSRTTW